MADDAPEFSQHDEDASVTRAYYALGFVAIIVVVGLWLANSFREHNRAIECMEARRHNCVPLDTSDRGR
jgi:hypothetical protein